MALNFPNVTLLGLSQESRFFGAGFNYSNSKRLSINGLVTDLINSFGISGIWTGEQGVLNTIKNNNNFDSLVLNNVNFGTGRILNFSFDPGRDVRTKSYTVELEVFDTGNLFNLTGTYYSGINTNNWQFLQEFSENYSFDKKQNGGYSYNHNATIRFNSGLGNLDAVSSAKTLAKTLFTGNSIGLAFYSGFTSKIGKRFYNESYSLIDNSCNFSETFDFDSNSGDYSVVRTNTFELAENGIVTVAENGTLRGIITPTHQKAIDALNTELSTAYDRCSGLYASYAPANSYQLLTSPLTQSRSLDIFQNNLGYSISFSNDIRNSGSYLWDYTQQISYSEGIARLTEAGNIQGKNYNRDSAYQSAKSAFINIVKPNFNSRATDFYNNFVSGGSFFIENKEESYSPYRGAVGYSYVFSNENVLVGSSGIKNINFQIDDNSPVYLYGKFNIINNKEIVQDAQNNTVGVKTVSLNLKGEKTVALTTYLENAKTQINSNLPSGGNDSYISNLNYSFNPNNNSLDVSTTWNYNKAATKTVSLNG